MRFKSSVELVKFYQNATLQKRSLQEAINPQRFKRYDPIRIFGAHKSQKSCCRCAQAAQVALPRTYCRCHPSQSRLVVCQSSRDIKQRDRSLAAMEQNSLEESISFEKSKRNCAYFDQPRSRVGGSCGFASLRCLPDVAI